uniref:Uncharacterized protein n=1 Tax=Timema cristinae TaxID=61476 RepID=A0A7R9CKQ2_TIMCR|nr:unnamed protein product [Timema cristinae]
MEFNQRTKDKSPSNNISAKQSPSSVKLSRMSLIYSSPWSSLSNIENMEQHYSMILNYTMILLGGAGISSADHKSPLPVTEATTYLFKYLLICPHEAELSPFQTHCFIEKSLTNRGSSPELPDYCGPRANKIQKLWPLEMKMLKTPGLRRYSRVITPFFVLNLHDTLFFVVSPHSILKLQVDNTTRDSGVPMQRQTSLSLNRKCIPYYSHCCGARIHRLHYATNDERLLRPTCARSRFESKQHGAVVHFIAFSSDCEARVLQHAPQIFGKHLCPGIRSNIPQRASPRTADRGALARFLLPYEPPSTLQQPQPRAGGPHDLERGNEGRRELAAITGQLKSILCAPPSPASPRLPTTHFSKHVRAESLNERMRTAVQVCPRANQESSLQFSRCRCFTSYTDVADRGVKVC